MVLFGVVIRVELGVVQLKSYKWNGMDGNLLRHQFYEQSGAPYQILTNAPVAVFAAIEVDLLLFVGKAGRSIGHHWLTFHV